MGLHQPKVVDAIGIERDTELVIMTVFDSWNCDNVPLHIEVWTAKLKSYLSCIESGEITEVYPEAVGRNIVIEIVSRYSIPASALPFLTSAQVAAEQLGVCLRTRYCPESEPTKA